MMPDEPDITSTAEGVDPAAVVRMLQGLPAAHGYSLVVKPLRYRERAHLSAWTDFEERSITLQIPEPFFPFGEVVPYAAKRRPTARKGGRTAVHLAHRRGDVPYPSRGGAVPLLP